MAIEIKELQIKAVIEPDPGSRQQTLNQATLDRLRKEILKECMQEMKNLLREQQER